MRAQVAVAIVVLTGLWTRAAGHDIYGDLKQPNGESCCSDQDCRPVDRWRDAAGGVEMMLDGRWVFIAEADVQRVLIPGDRSRSLAHWCGFKDGDQYETFCAIVPPEVF